MQEEIPKAKLIAVFEPCEEGGYHAFIPEIPGIHTQGETLEETRENLADAEAERGIRFYNAVMVRACMRIGELSRELEKAQGERTELLPTDGKKLSKEHTLAAAGISTTTASFGVTAIRDRSNIGTGRIYYTFTVCCVLFASLP